MAKPQDFLKDIIKTTGNEYATLADAGIESGDVKLFDTKKLREKSTLIKFHEFNGKMYKKTNQTEYDKYKFSLEPLSDNARVYNLLNNLHNKKNKIKVTII